MNCNKNNIKLLNILDWKDPSIELLRLDFKKSGLFTYLPKSIVEFLGLRKEEDRSLIALLDSESEYNYVILVLDRDLISLLKPIILSRREKAQKLQQELKRQLQSQQQVTKVEEVLSNEEIK